MYTDRHSKLQYWDMCYSFSGVRQTDTSIVVVAGIVVYVAVVWHLLSGGLTSNSRAKPSRNPTGGWPLGAGPQSVLLCRLLNTTCALHIVRLPPPAVWCPHHPLVRLVVRVSYCWRCVVMVVVYATGWVVC